MSDGTLPKSLEVAFDLMRKHSARLAIEDQLAAAVARAERAEAALALLQSRAADLLFCYRHGNGLDGWHKAADGLDNALAEIAAMKNGAA